MSGTYSCAGQIDARILLPSHSNRIFPDIHQIQGLGNHKTQKLARGIRRIGFFLRNKFFFSLAPDHCEAVVTGQCGVSGRQSICPRKDWAFRIGAKENESVRAMWHFLVFQFLCLKFRFRATVPESAKIQYECEGNRMRACRW